MNGLSPCCCNNENKKGLSNPYLQKVTKVACFLWCRTQIELLSTDKRRKLGLVVQQS